MYPEFIPIYIGLAVAIVLLTAILIMQIILLRRGRSAAAEHPIRTVKAGAADSSGIAFCTRCSTQMKPGERFCPNCGTPR